MDIEKCETETSGTNLDSFASYLFDVVLPGQNGGPWGDPPVRRLLVK